MQFLLLFADNTTTPPAGGDSGSPFGSLGMWVPIILMMVAFYFLMILPMRRQEKQRQALLSQLKRNDKVVTSGGIIGIVDKVKEKEDEVTLKVDEGSNLRIKVTRSSIVKVISGEEAAKETKEGGA